MCVNPTEILLPLIEKLENEATLTCEEVRALTEAVRTLMTENQLIPFLRNTTLGVPNKLAARASSTQCLHDPLES